ncbi:MAG: glycosyl transferase [Planctomycetaceae bacterium]|nr:glycosyl transferase [Planctomycetaceae bacterium]
MLISLATYNEIENIPDLVNDIQVVLPKADVLVVDDNSPDGTGKWVAERSKCDHRLHGLHRGSKQGLGTAILAGMRFAAEKDYDYFVSMDADYSHHPQFLPALVAGMEQQRRLACDVMIGSRYVSGGGIHGWPWTRRIMSRAVNLYARWLLRLSAGDCSGGFRCYRISSLRRIDPSTVRSAGYAFQEEFLWCLKKSGAEIAETPICFADRTRGQSKIDFHEAWSALWVIGRLGLKTWLGI